MDLNEILNYFKQSDEEQKPQEPDLLELYKKYNQGYTPEEADQVGKVLGNASFTGSENGPLKVESAPPPVVMPSQDALAEARKVAGFPEHPVMQQPQPERELAQQPQQKEKQVRPIQPSPDAIQGLHQQLSKVQPEQSPNEDLVGQLRGAQEASNQNQLFQGIQRGLEQVSAGISRTTPNHGGSDNLKAGVNQPVTNLQQKIGVSQLQNKLNDDKEMSDPASATSIMLRDFAKKFGMSLPENVSGKNIVKVAPYLVQAFESAENRKARLQIAQENASTKRELNSDKQTTKEDDKTTNRFDKMGKLVSAEITSGRSSLGQDAQAIRAIDNAQTLLHGSKNLNDLDSRQVYEAARVLDRVLSGGTGSIKSSSKLTPETAHSYMNEVFEKLSNKRRGAGLGDFMKSMDQTFSREKSRAEDRIKKAQTKLLGNFRDLKDKDPDKWQTIMTQHGLPNDPFTETVRVKSPTGQTKLIPKDQLDAAIKAGGTLVE